MAVKGFDATYYLENNRDVVTAIVRGAFKNAEDHFKQFGASEGRKPNADFDTSYYTINNSDVLDAVNKKAFVTVFDHYLKHGSSEIRLGEKNEGAEKVGKAFRAPNKEVATLVETFDGDAYLKAHPDVNVKEYSAKTAFKHYLDVGKGLGYKPTTKEGATGATPGNTFYTSSIPVVLLPDAAPVGAVAAPETSKKGMTSGADTVYVTVDTHLSGGQIDDANTGDGDRLVIVSLENPVVPSSVNNVETIDIRVRGTAGELDFAAIKGTKTVNLSGSGSTKLLNVESGIEYTLKGGGVFGLTILSGSKNTDSDAATLTLKGDVDLTNLNLGGSEKDDIDQLTINNSGTNRVALSTAFTKDESITIKGASGLMLASAWANVKDAVIKTEGSLTFGLEISDALNTSTTVTSVTYNLTKLSSLDKVALSGLGTSPTAGATGAIVPAITLGGIASSVKAIELTTTGVGTTTNPVFDFIGGGAATVANGLTLNGLQSDAGGNPIKGSDGKQIDNWSGSNDSLTLLLNKGRDIGGKLSAKGIETLTIDSGSVADHKIGGVVLNAGATLKLVGSQALTLGTVEGGANTIDASALGGGVTLTLTAPPAGVVNGSAFPTNYVITSSGTDKITLSGGRDLIEFNSTKVLGSFSSATATAASTADDIVGTLTSNARVRLSGDFSFTSSADGGVTGLGVGAVTFTGNKAVAVTGTGSALAADTDLFDVKKVLDALGSAATSGKLLAGSEGQKGLILVKGNAKTGVYYVNDSHGVATGSVANGVIEFDEIKLVGTFAGDLTANTTAVNAMLKDVFIIG